MNNEVKNTIINVPESKNETGLKVFISISVTVYFIATCLFIIFQMLGFEHFSFGSMPQWAEDQMSFYNTIATFILFGKMIFMVTMVLIASFVWRKSELSKKFLKWYVIYILLKPVFIIINSVIFLLGAVALSLITG